MLRIADAFCFVLFTAASTMTAVQIGKQGQATTAAATAIAAAEATAPIANHTVDAIF